MLGKMTRETGGAAMSACRTCSARGYVSTGLGQCEPCPACGGDGYGPDGERALSAYLAAANDLSHLKTRLETAARNHAGQARAQQRLGWPADAQVALGVAVALRAAAAALDGLLAQTCYRGRTPARGGLAIAPGTRA